MGKFLKIALVMGALMMTACSKSVDGVPSPVSPNNPLPIGWDNTISTSETTAQFQNTSAHTKSVLKSVNFTLKNPVIYKDSSSVEFVMVRLETTILPRCAGSTDSTCSNDLRNKDLSEITIRGSHGGSCVYRRQSDGEYSIVPVGQECALSLNSTKSLIVDELLGEVTIRFHIQYQKLN